MRLFHGTSLTLLDSILSQGLLLGTGQNWINMKFDGGDSHLKGIIDNCTGRVFFAQSLDAGAHAGLAALKTKDDKVVVLEVSIPDHVEVKDDPVELAAYFIEVSVQPEWIVDAHILTITQLRRDAYRWDYTSIYAQVKRAI